MKRQPQYSSGLPLDVLGASVGARQKGRGRYTFCTASIASEAVRLMRAVPDLLHSHRDVPGPRFVAPTIPITDRLWTLPPFAFP